MANNQSHPLPQPDGNFRQYVSEIEPLVQKAAPMVGDDRAYLGSPTELAPSRPVTFDRLTPADWSWLAALADVAHRHQLSYELVTHEGGGDHLWLVPRH
jgi:hypothetical protein